jgi:Mg2+ and Co2+ transporter CorA
LLDPTIKEGTPLWHGYRNWETTPGVGGKIPCAPPQYSLFKDLIHWAQKPAVFKTSSSDNSSITHVPVQALLHLICAEWLTMVEYIKTRLSQIEWEVSMPEYFLDKGIRDDVMLTKLHFWRRVVPIYRELLTETIQRVSSFPCHTGRMGSMTSNSTSQQAAKPEEQQPDKQEPVRPGAINAFRDDFDRALSYMKEYQERIDRLTSVVTAMISIQDTRLSMQDARREQANNRNVARLTWLAMFFVPLSLVASLFSMQEDVGMLNKTYKLYFEVAFPVAAVTLGLGFVFTRPSVQRLGSRIKKGAQIMKKEAHEEGSVRMKKWRQKKKKTKKQKRADDKV